MESGSKWRTQQKRNEEGMSPYPSLSLPTSALLFLLLTFLCVYESRGPFTPVLIIVKASLFWEWVLCPAPNLSVNVYISRGYSCKNGPSKMTNIASSTTLPTVCTPSTVPKFILRNVLGKLYHTVIYHMIDCMQNSTSVLMIHALWNPSKNNLKKTMSQLFVPPTEKEFFQITI